jgi:hypothetical protein
MHHSNPIVLLIPFSLIILLMTGYIALNNWRLEFSRALSDLSREFDELDFSASCSPDGQLNDRNHRNCVDQRGYRIVRSGLDAIIFQQTANGPQVFFRSSPDDRRISGNTAVIKDVLRAFRIEINEKE